MKPRTLFFANALLVAALFAGSMLAWPHLPARIPTHFDLAGNVTSWTPTSRLWWYGLPAAAAATALLVWGAARLARTSPSLWNVPEKQRFLQLSPEGRAPFVAELERIVAWTGLSVTVAFALVQAAVYATATGRAPGLARWMIFLVLLPVAAALVLAVRSAIRMRPRIRAAADAEGIPPPRWG